MLSPREYKPSLAALVLANAFPLAGVLFLGWEIFPVVLLFWAENIVVGVINLLKLAMAQRTDPPFAKYFLVPFFCVHYGMFCAVHGMFVFSLFGGPDRGPVRDLPALALALLALTVSHAYSFAVNYVRAGEYRRADANQLMFQPYARVVVLHLAILGGGILIAYLGSPLGGLVLLVLLKTAFDAAAHLRERSKYSGG